MLFWVEYRCDDREVTVDIWTSSDERMNEDRGNDLLND
jgi:membrane-bound inhibitor of C-type lysozyme